MSPEQARGEVDQLDERCDVFGLGAILCVILTGQPPYPGLGGKEAYRQAEKAELAEAHARLETCGADAELLRLAKACLSPQREHRPRDAGEVARALAAYQAGVRERLQRAEQERAVAQVEVREEHKRRRLTVALAVAGLLVVSLAGAGALYVQRQGAERAAEALRNREAIAGALDKARELGLQGRWAEARAVLEQTRDRLGETGPEDLRQRVQQATDDMDLVDRLEAIRLKRSAIVEGKVNDRIAEPSYAAAFREAGLVVEGDEPEAVAARLRASAVREQLVAALDDWATLTHDPERRLWLLEVSRRADPDDWRDRFRDPALDRAGVEALAKELLADARQLARQKPAMLCVLGSFLQESGPVPLLRAAQRHHPDDFWLNFDLANALMVAKKWDEAVGFCRAAVALRPSAVVAHNNLSAALFENRQLDEALQAARQAKALDPHYALPYVSLGNALRRKGQLDEAIQQYRTAIDLDPKLAVPHNNIGSVLRDRRQLDGAIEEFRQAIALDPKFALAHYNLGVTLKEKGQLDEAIREYRAAIALDPKMARAYCNLGKTLLAKKQPDEAIRELRTALALDPKDVIAHCGLGDALQQKKQLDKAIEEYHKAIDLNPKYVEAHNGLGTALRAKGQLDAAAQEFHKAIALDPRYAKAHYNLGNVLHDKRQVDDAIQEYRRAIDLDPNYFLAHYNLAVNLYWKGQLDEAIQESRKAVDLDPKHVGSRYWLAVALRDRGQLDEAVQEYRAAIALDPKAAQFHGAVGEVLLQLGRFPEARKETRRCLDLLPPNDPLQQQATQQLQRCEQFLALDQKLTAIGEGKQQPANAAECLALARLCQQPYKQLYVASVRFYTEAVAEQPKLAADPRTGARYHAVWAAVFAAAGKGKDADKLADPERARLRKQALNWLRADLALWAKELNKGTPQARTDVQRALAHWQHDPNLAGVRGKEALARLPRGEGQAWAQFWADVGALLAKARDAK
jgi:tetratricopeptide (TPR) repeat protein